MGNNPSRTQVIEIKKVEIVRNPQSDRPAKRPEDGSKKRAEEVKKPYVKEPAKDERKNKSRVEPEKKERKYGEKTEEKTEEGKDEKKRKKKTKPPPIPPESAKSKAPDFTNDDLIKDEFESVTEIKASPSDDKKENIIKKIIRVIGISQMSPKNFSVLFILWSMRFYIPWVNTWWNFNKHILSDPAHLEALEPYLFMHEILGFLGLSCLCVLLSVFADVFNLKYILYVMLTAIFILCPVTGLVAINVLWARGYARPVYHEYSPKVYVAMYWAKSIPYVAYPLEFCCFFTQVDDMTREAHYNYAAIFVLLDSINRLICFYVIPGECPTLQWTLASVWIAIGIMIHTLFLLSCFFIVWVVPANKVLNRSPFVLKVVKRINVVLRKLKMTACVIDETPRETRLDSFNEKATPFMKKLKMVLFGLILIPLMFSSFVIAILHRLEIDEDWDRHEFHSASSMFIFGRVIGVVLVALILLLLRRNTKIKFLNKFSFTRPDVMVLGLPHVIIALALALIAVRFGSLHSLKEGDTIIGPIPDAERSVIEVYNADFRNRTVCVFSEKFRPMKVGPRKRETRNPPDPGVTRFEIVVTIAPRTTPPVLTHEVLNFAANSLITLVVTLNASESTANDLQALYTKFELNRVSGTESVKPKQVPQLIIINSFMLNTSSYFIHVTQFQANFSQKIEVPPKESAHVMDIVAGRIDLRYENEGTNNTQDPTQPILEWMNVDNFTVWSLVLGLATAHNASNETEPYNVLLNKYLVMQVAGPAGSQLPDKRQLQQDVVIMAGMCLSGIAEAGLLVGFMYLFWLDTPIGELRVTTLACFSIALAIPQEFPRLKLVDITTGVAVFLLCLQIIFTVVHFIGAIFLYDQAFNFRKNDR